MPGRPVIVVEDDPFTRLIQIVLDPQTSEERRAAFADWDSVTIDEASSRCEECAAS